MAERLARSVASPPFRAGDGGREHDRQRGGRRFGRRARPGRVWRNADMAMSRAKERGEGRVEIYAGAGPGDDPCRAGPGRRRSPAGAGPDVSPAGTGVVNGAAAAAARAAR